MFEPCIFNSTRSYTYCKVHDRLQVSDNKEIRTRKTTESTEGGQSLLCNPFSLSSAQVGGLGREDRQTK